jgi:hypothetical protein
VWSRLNSGTLRVNFDFRLERPFWRSCGHVNELIISSESEIGLVQDIAVSFPAVPAYSILGVRTRNGK